MKCYLCSEDIEEREEIVNYIGNLICKGCAKGIPKQFINNLDDRKAIPEAIRKKSYKKKRK